MNRLRSSPRPPRLSRSIVIIAFYGGLAGIALLWGWWTGRRDLFHYGNEPPARLWGPLVGLAFALVVVFFSRLVTHRFEWARFLHREFHAVVHELSLGEIFLLAASSSVGEELFFRGALMPKIGIWASTALFAALHVRRHRGFLPWTLMSFVLGLALALMYRELGDLSGPIVAHFTINFLNLRYIVKTDMQ